MAASNLSPFVSRVNNTVIAHAAAVFGALSKFPAWHARSSLKKYYWRNKTKTGQFLHKTRAIVVFIAVFLYARFLAFLDSEK